MKMATQERIEKVYAALRIDHWMRTEEVAQKTEMTRNHARAALHALGASGCIDFRFRRHGYRGAPSPEYRRRVEIPAMDYAAPLGDPYPVSARKPALDEEPDED